MTTTTPKPSPKPHSVAPKPGAKNPEKVLNAALAAGEASGEAAAFDLEQLVAAKRAKPTNPKAPKARPAAATPKAKPVAAVTPQAPKPVTSREELVKLVTESKSPFTVTIK
jgi:hypothetical protein